MPTDPLHERAGHGDRRHDAAFDPRALPPTRRDECVFFSPATAVPFEKKNTHKQKTLVNGT
jgi:hypothetical protein